MYLKTTYLNHCEEDDSKCADHCRVFALSHAGDTDVQKVCSHSHNVKCEDCEKLKSVLEEVNGVISEYTMQLGRFQAEDYLCEAKNAELVELAELVAVATEPLTSTSKLPMGWALHKRGASERLSQNVRQYLKQKFNIG